MEWRRPLGPTTKQEEKEAQWKDIDGLIKEQDRVNELAMLRVLPPFQNNVPLKRARPKKVGNSKMDGGNAREMKFGRKSVEDASFKCSTICISRQICYSLVCFLRKVLYRISHCRCGGY